MKSRKNLAIIGIGRWGKNLLREFNRVADICYVYHRGNPENNTWLKQNYPNLTVAKSYEQILEDSSVNAVVIATPIATHYGLAKKAILAGKNVFVEKPITDNVKQARELIKLAAKRKLVLFVGHIFSYHPILTKIKQLTRNEPLKYVGFVWNKWGTFNEELVYNLASHDIATALDLLGIPKKTEIIENRGIISSSDVLFMRLGFRGGNATIYINRVSNFKNKTITLVTAKNTYILENDRLFKFDKKTSSPKLIYQIHETPLEIECAEFVKCITKNKTPHTSGEFGAEVIKILSRV